ncbi:histidine phosphatase family protein [Palleronia caenipelagi]|uniref:Histidine phosphatase family protein n=1 Tax=Palleronia caenipelagi TaxID=2489174 RepID=A0A547Q7C0_9RHOB|nr:histidine phosphatase family protein [Palleronia caenipelagi]TRD22261.1 histidine phosphatase family protein [Palleronia caenipelagi]
MGEIVLVRHGQANSAATNEEDYDRLSDLGHRQARWLGDWMRKSEPSFDLVLCGTLRRHRETAEGIGVVATPDARLNEMDYFNLGQALQDVHGIPMPEADGFDTHVHLVMQAWHAAEIKGNESFESFDTRITSVLNEASEIGKRVLCITSGGVIGMAMRHVLGLGTEALADAMLPILNTSVHRFRVRPRGMLLTQFNAVPHLMGDERAEALTHY